MNTAEIVAELLRQAAQIAQENGLTIEDFVEVAAHAYAAGEGDEISDCKVELRLTEREFLN